MGFSCIITEEVADSISAIDVDVVCLSSVLRKQGKKEMQNKQSKTGRGNGQIEGRAVSYKIIN